LGVCCPFEENVQVPSCGAVSASLKNAAKSEPSGAKQIVSPLPSKASGEPFGLPARGIFLDQKPELMFEPLPFSEMVLGDVNSWEKPPTKVSSITNVAVVLVEETGLLPCE
jgi:hypothetical protein